MSEMQISADAYMEESIICVLSGEECTVSNCTVCPVAINELRNEMRDKVMNYTKFVRDSRIGKLKMKVNPINTIGRFENQDPVNVANAFLIMPQ